MIVQPVVEPMDSFTALILFIHLLHCVDTGLRLGAAPGLVPEGDVELHGPDRRLMRDHLIYNGHDVRFRYQNFSRN